MINENSTFGGFLTDIGEAKQANANALGIPWKLTHMLIGDANGTDPVPDPGQTQLINQRYRAAINQLSVDPANPAILIAEIVLPPNVGGWWIRELGLEDEDGDFVAVANCPPSYKPLLAQGSGRNQVVRMHLILSNTANVQLKIDPSVVLATRKHVDDGDATVAQALQDHAQSSDHPAATTTKQGMVEKATVAEAKAGTANKFPDAAGMQEAIAEKLAPLSDNVKWLSRAIGEEVWLDDSDPATEIPPTDNPNFRYVKLTAGENGSGGYNEGVLINEDVSGSAPLIEATAEVNLPGSPWNGKTIRLLNTERRFVRAGEAGVVQDDQMQRITGTITNVEARADYSSVTAEGAFSISAGSGSTAGNGNNPPSNIFFDSAESPDARVGNATYPSNVGRTGYKRIK